MSKLSLGDLSLAIHFWQVRGREILTSLGMNSENLEVDLKDPNFVECKREIERLNKLKASL